MTKFAKMAVLAAFALPMAAAAQDAEPVAEPTTEPVQETATEPPMDAQTGTSAPTSTTATPPATTAPSTTTPTTTPAQPRDPNTVLGGTTTFPRGQTPPVPGIVQGPLSEWDGLYAEAAIGTLNINGSTGAVTARGGFQTRRLVGFEVEYSTGLSDFELGLRAAPGSENLEPNAFRSAEVSSIAAGFVRARFPLDDRVGVFARVGYHETKVDFVDELLERDESGELVVDNNRVFLSGQTTEFSRSYDGLATGLGAEISISERVGARLEFARYEIGNDLTINYITIGGQFRF